MFRCPTCVTVLEDPHAKRCPVCGENLRRHPPLVLRQSARVSAKLQAIDLRPQAEHGARRWRRRGAPATATGAPAGPDSIDLTPEAAADASDATHERAADSIDLTPEPEPEPAPAHRGPGAADGPGAPEVGGTSTATRVATPVPGILHDTARRIEPEMIGVDPGEGLLAPRQAGRHSGDPSRDGGVESPWLLPPRRAWDPPDPSVGELSRHRRRLPRPRLPKARFPRPRFLRLRALRPRFG